MEAIEMTFLEMVMKFLSVGLLVALVGIPLVLWAILVVALVRRVVRDIHERLLDRAYDRRRRTAAHAVVVTASAVLAEVPDTVVATAPQVEPAPRHAHARVAAVPLDEQPAEVIAAVAHRVFHHAP
jgi:hypothetical protein